MNKSMLIFGYVLFFSGIVLFGFMQLAIALYIPHLSNWSDPPGELTIVLNEIMGWFPYILSIGLMIIGGLMVIHHLYLIYRAEKDNHFTK